jgi:hypothetical protein
MRSGTGILPVGFGGIGILPMIHGLEAHATLNRVSMHVLKAGRTASRPDEEQYPRCRDNEQEKTTARQSSILRWPTSALTHLSTVHRMRTLSSMGILPMIGDPWAGRPCYFHGRLARDPESMGARAHTTKAKQ